MPYRIEVALKEGFFDALSEEIKRALKEHLGVEVESVKRVEVYLVDAELKEEELEEFVKSALSDPVTQCFSIDEPLFWDFDWLIEVGFLPGVTDNVGRTAREALEVMLSRPLGEEEGVYTATKYLIKGNLTEEEAWRVARDYLGNPLINRFIVLHRSQWDPKTFPIEVPRVRGLIGGKVQKFNLSLLSDEELLKLSRERLLALSLEEMKAIRDYFQREKVLRERERYGLGEEITDVELEAIAQTWSEHCKHKIFNARIHYVDEELGEEEIIESLFDTFIRRSTEEIRKILGPKDRCVKVFKDNAGIWAFNDDWLITIKVETHNTPSALDPYGGALTGILGVQRDAFGAGKGAKLIFNTDVFCFAPPDFQGPLPPKVLHPRRIMEGVVKGVEDGGNKMGIPTINGSILFDERYLGKPLVYCGSCGIMPRLILGEPAHEKRARPGDFIVMVGGRVGKDGIHGATFSSETLSEASPTSAVQIGDPIVQKRMFDCLLRARDRGLYTSITDNGAGGLSSSAGEMAREAGGCEIWLDKVPLKYAGLDPWEILLSESQERMTLAVPPEKVEELLELAKSMEVEATVIGRFTSSGKFHCLWKGETVAYLDMDFFHEGLPRMNLQARWKRPLYPEPDFPPPEDYGEMLEKMLSRLNVASKEWVVRRYDHEVQGGSVCKPLVGKMDDGPQDAAVIRPLLDSLEGIVVSHGICPKYGDIDTYWMTACALEEAIRNNICAGGDPERMAALDNFCWPDPLPSEDNPDAHFKLAQLVRANKALYDFTKAFLVPCISGKDSMKNDYVGKGIRISIPPTVLFTVISKIDDVRISMTMDVKRPGDLLYVLGVTYPELGGSEYFRLMGFIGNEVPKVRPQVSRGLFLRLHQAIKEGLIASCHDCSDGGLAVALAEKAFAGGFGLVVDLQAVPRENVNRDDYLLFSESQGRFVVTVPPEKHKAFEELMKGLPFGLIGKVTEEETLKVIGLEGKEIIKSPLASLKEAWQKPFRDYLKVDKTWGNGRLG